MCPYSGRGLPTIKRIFSYRLSRAENAFGILAARWRIFRRQAICEPSVMVKYVKACCVLHNFLMTTSPATYPNVHDDVTQQKATIDFRCGSNNYNSNSQQIRDKFAAYFQTSEGMVSWQNDIVYHGL
jgi:hypothetical protein